MTELLATNRNSQLYKTLSAIVGPERVAEEDLAKWAVMGDIHPGLMPPDSKFTTLPDIIVRPQTVEHVSKILRVANRMRTPVTVRGGGEGCASAMLPSEGGILMDMLDMNQIVKIDETSMVATAEAACTWGKLTYELKKKGYRPGVLGPGGIYGATLAGSVGHNSYLISGGRYGMCGEEVVSLEVVLPTGEVINTGSATNIRSDWLMRYANGADLTGLFIGDEGAFGVKTKVSLRIYPLPEYALYETYSFSGLDKAAQALYKMQLTSHLEDSFINAGRHALEIFVPDAPKDSELVQYIILEGYDAKIVEREKEIMDSIAGQHDGKALGSEIASRFFDGRRSGKAIGWAWGFGTPGCSLLPTLKFPEFTRGAYDFFRKHEDLIINVPGTDLKAYYVKVYPVKHAYVNCLPYSHYDATTLEGQKKGYELWRKLIQWRLDQGACNYWVGLDCADLVASHYPPFFHDFVQRIKTALDPNHILNRGIYLL